jgi:hypothetical protein
MTSVVMCIARKAFWNLLLSRHLYFSGSTSANVMKDHRAQGGVHWKAVPRRDMRPQHMRMGRRVQCMMLKIRDVLRVRRRMKKRRESLEQYTLK